MFAKSLRRWSSARWFLSGLLRMFSRTAELLQTGSKGPEVTVMTTASELAASFANGASLR